MRYTSNYRMYCFLRFLIADINQLTGPIPSELGLSTHLERLNFGESRMTGVWLSANATHLNLSVLSIVWIVDDNQLSGPIPSELGMLTQLARLDFGM